ncbi:MAG: pentapeptide repeat-containing protein, partial [Jiangellaceae bacterium]
MSAKRPFAGKWQVVLDTKDTNTFLGTYKGQGCSGRNLILYRTGQLSSTLYQGLAQLQPDGVAQGTPADLNASYLSPVPYPGNYDRPNGVSTDAAATQWAYNDSATYPTPALSPLTGPAGGVFGWWNTPPYPVVWGWLTSNTTPAKPGTYSIAITAPSAYHLRGHTGAPVPAGSDYTWCDLSHEDYSGLSLRGAVFAGADLTGVDFSGTDLTGASFRGVVSVAGATFAKADLSGADFTGVDLTGHDLSGLPMPAVKVAGARLAGVNFTGTDLSGTDFRQAKDYAGMNLTEADCSSCRFDGLRLTGFKFPGTQLRRASFTGATLDQAQFYPAGTHDCDLSYVDFRQPKSLTGVRLSANLTNTTFDELVFDGLDFTGARTDGASFAGADMRNARFSPNQVWCASSATMTDLSRAQISFGQLGPIWNNVDLSGTQITDLPADMSNLKAQRAIVTNRNLSQHNLQYCDFTDADLRGSTFVGSNLAYSMFTTAQLQGDSARHLVAASFTGACLEGVSFEQANLTGVIFDGAFFLAEPTLSGAIIVGAYFEDAYLA